VSTGQLTLRRKAKIKTAVRCLTTLLPSFFAPIDKALMGIEDKISEVAQGPAKASGDAGAVEQQNLKDLIEADKYLAQKNAAKVKGLGIKQVQLIPPGTI